MGLVGDAAKKGSSLGPSAKHLTRVSGWMERKVRLGKEKWAKKLRRAQDIRENEGEVSSFTLRLEDMEWRALG